MCRTCLMSTSGKPSPTLLLDDYQLLKLIIGTSSSFSSFSPLSHVSGGQLTYNRLRWYSYDAFSLRIWIRFVRSVPEWTGEGGYIYGIPSEDRFAKHHRNDLVVSVRVSAITVHGIVTLDFRNRIGAFLCGNTPTKTYHKTTPLWQITLFLSSPLPCPLIYATAYVTE